MKGYIRRVTGAMLALGILLATLPLTVAASSEPAYYGREALKNMTNGNELVRAYDQLVDEIADREERFPLSVPLSDIETVFDAYFYDHGEVYYLTTEYGYYYDKTTQKTTEFVPEYRDMTHRQEHLFEDALEDVLDAAGITSKMSDYDKALALHDALTDRVEYVKTDMAHTAYGALVEGNAVCDGYAKAYQCLLREAGITSHLVTGYSTSPYTGEPEGHAWNLVELDGQYYYTDVTWDDQPGQRFYMYLNVTEEVLTEDHWITEPAYGLPECTATAANYFTRHPETIITASPDAAQIASLLDEHGFARVYVTGDVEVFLDWYFDGSNATAIAQKAGITGRFQYGASYLGREFHLSITSLTEEIALPTAATGLVFNGSAQTGVPAGKGYTVTGNTATDAGTYVATVRLKDGYAWNDGTIGDLHIRWSIAQKPVTAEELTLTAIAEQAYTGQALLPNVTLTCGQNALQKDRDYTVSYTDNVNVGTATVTVTPADTGNYNWSGSLTVTFRITPAAGAVSLKTADGQTKLTLTLPDTLDPAAHLLATANSDGEITLKYYTNKACTEGESLTPPTEPGTYWIKAVLAPGTNHTAAESNALRFTLVDPDDPNPPVEEEPHYGKLDDDDAVSVSDALVALQAVTGKVELSEEARINADVDGQPGVTANDALIILQFATRKIASFPCEG